MPSSTSSSEPSSSGAPTGLGRFSGLLRLAGIATLFVVFCLPAVLANLERERPFAGVGLPKYQWIDQVLEEDGERLEIVAVGSSRIWSAWDAARVEQDLVGRPRSAANLGTPSVGRERDFITVREVLRRTSVKTIVVEVADRERDAFHPSFPTMASLPDVVEDIWLTGVGAGSTREARERLSISTGRLFEAAFRVYSDLLPRLVRRGPEVGTESLASIAETRGFRPTSGRFDGPPVVPRRSAWRPRPGARPTAYLDRIATLCREADVDLIFLQVPPHGAPALSPRWRAWLEARGRVIEVDALASLYAGPYWADASHLSPVGAARFTEHFIRALGSTRGDATTPTR